MSEEQKRATPKVKLPIKTKIAMWWLKIIGVLLTILAMLSLISSCFASFDAGPVGRNWFVLGLLLVLSGILLICSGILVSKISGRSWVLGSALLIIAMILFATVFLIDIYQRQIPEGGITDTMLVILPLGILILLTTSNSHPPRQQELL
jgi:hypothetical protein